MNYRLAGLTWRKHMKAAVINRIDGTFDVEELEIDEPRGAEVLVEVKAAGLCHSDMLVASVERGRPLPMVAGHEMAGIVVGLGPEAADFQLGDHVIASEINFCGRCEECVNGATYRCMDPASISRGPDAVPKLSRDGQAVNAFGVAGFAEYTLVHQNKLVRIPDRIPFPQAAVLGCATTTGVGAALNSAGVQPGDTVAVVGLGGIGLNIVSGARIAGAKAVIGIDLQPAKLELARKFGATHVINSGAEDTALRVKEITGRGVNHSFEAIGLGATQKLAIGLARTGGGVYFIGIPQGKPLDFNVMTDLLIGQRRLQGVYMGSSNIRSDIPYYADLYLQGRLNLDDLIAQQISLTEINDAYGMQETGAIARSVITF